MDTETKDVCRSSENLLWKDAGKNICFKWVKGTLKLMVSFISEIPLYDSTVFVCTFHKDSTHKLWVSTWRTIQSTPIKTVSWRQQGKKQKNHKNKKVKPYTCFQSQGHVK